MPKASELKKGNVVEINNQPYVVKSVDAKSPSSRGAQTLYKIRFNHAQTGQKLDESFSGDIQLKSADFSRRAVQFLFKEGDEYTFMDKEDYSQHILPKAKLEEQRSFLNEELEGIYGLILEDILIGIELPQSVVQTIIETAPAIKGATATGRTKPATTESGLEVQVPEYLTSGDKIKISTETGKFMSRST